MSPFVIPSIFTAIDKLTSPVKKMDETVSSFAMRTERNLAKIGNASMNIAKKSFILGAAIALPLFVAGKEAVKFEDKMADVAKTTGLAGSDLDAFGKGILGLAPDTRTSIEELQSIAAIGGSMGVANKELLGFTDSVNKFNVALGSDFGGVEPAAKAISGLKTLFKETRDIDVATAITKTGSAINALSAQGVAVPEVTEFISRIGQLPDAIKPSIQATAALAATFNKAGITAEIGSRAFGDILLTAGQNLPKFAKQMGMSEKAARGLINADPTAFAVKFAKSLDGMDAVQLAKTLKKLKLGDSGTIKAVGALSSGSEMLAKFQGIANAEFEKGTSLLNEYNQKNETTAAKIKKAENNFQALGIIIGTELLPVVADFIKMVTPVISRTIRWAKENPGLTKTIVGTAVAVAALSFAVSGISFTIGLVTKTMAAWGLITKLFSGWTYIATAAQWAFNFAMNANPIGIIVVAVAALIALLVLAVKHWHEWGAALAIFLGPLGIVVSLIQAFRRNWDMIAEAFAKGGFIEGLKAIGKTILDVILLPLQQILEIISKITGADWAAAAAKGIEGFRADLGVNTSTDESGQPLPVLNPAQSKQNALSSALQESIQTQNVNIDIQDKTGRAKMQTDNSIVPVRLTSTMSY
jgi:TP901 family phage tail tape measure protein